MRDAWKRAARAPQLGLAGLLLLLSLACASASAPVTPEPPVSTGTPVADGIAQTTIEAATPTPPRTFEATSERTGEIQAADNDSKDTSDSVQRSGGTSGGGQAASIPRSGGNGGDEKAASIPRSGGTGGDEKAASIPRSGGTGGDDQALPIPDKGELKYPNLGSRLDELVASVEAGQTTDQEAAEEAAVHSGALVAVTIYLSGGVDEVVAFLEENGGDPRNVGEDYVEAYVPVTLLGPVSEQPGVLRVREIVPPERGQGG